MPKFKRDDVTLHYEINGTGEPLIYISGFSDHSNSVFSAGIRETLSEKYQVLTLDNRGSGQTIVGENASVTLNDMADDVAALAQEQGITQAHILGISMGGTIAQHLALRHPELVKSLVLAVTLARSESPSRAQFMLQTANQMRSAGISHEIIRRYTAVFLLNEAVFKIEPFMAAWVSMPEDPFAQTETGYQQQNSAMHPFDITEQIGTISVPTLVVSSPDDMLVPPRFQEEIAGLIPNAELKHYPGGHVFMGLPRFRDAFFKDVFAFWERQV